VFPRTATFEKTGKFDYASNKAGVGPYELNTGGGGED
jgi:hypothetical protein